MTNHPTRPKIPANIKQRVRQRCCFGCIICGLPIFEYDHIEEYAKVKTHEVDNITLLCPTHHTAKTNGQFSEEHIKHYDKNPFNKDKPFSSPYKLFIRKNENDHMLLKIGGNELEFVNYALRIKNKPIIYFTNDNGSLLLNLLLTDKTGKEILKVGKFQDLYY